MTFEYHSSFDPHCEPNCGTCGASVGSALDFDVTTPDLMTVHVYICDDCLVKLFKAVLLLSWAMRETMLQEAVAVLEAGG